MASLTLQELNALLTEARKANHALLTGKAVALVRDQNNEEIRYTQADAGRLAAYIRQLEDEVAAKTSGSCAPLGPMRVFF